QKITECSMELEKSESVSPHISEESQPGVVYNEEKPAESASPPSSTPQSKSGLVAAPLRGGRPAAAGTVEHLAARQVLPELDVETPEMKLLLSELRSQVTQLIAALRWENKPIEEAADELIPLLNVGPVEQWKGILMP